MPRLISLLILLITCNIGFAEDIKFKDIPENHWAEKSVQNLVKLGVTSGYPDRTFRGLSVMNREEMAVFLSNFAKNSGNVSEIEKLGAEIKNEYTTLKYKIENPDQPQIRAEYYQIIMPKLDYRLKMSLFEKMGLNGSIKINFDTMDSSLYSTNLDITGKFLDIDGRFKLGKIFYNATFGPGPIIHKEKDPATISDDSIVYLRPKTGLTANTKFQTLDLALGYKASKLSIFGEPAAGEVFGRISYAGILPALGKTTISILPHYFSGSASKDMIGEVAINSNLSSVLTSELLLGIGSTNSSSGLMAKASLIFDAEPTDIILTAYKIGSGYRQAIDAYELIYLNAFNKLISDGSIDVGLNIKHKMNNKLTIIAKSDAVATSALKLGKDHPGTSVTYELGLNFSLSNTANLYTYYRAYNVPSTISSIDPNLSISAPELSDFFAVTISLMI